MAENPATGPEPTTAGTPGPDPWANTDSWLRLLLTVIYFVIFWLSLWLLGLAVVINLGALIFTGRRNQAVTGFARQLAAYQRQMALFASQAGDQRPFPFGEPLPDSQEPADNPVTVTATAPADTAGQTATAEADKTPPGSAPAGAKKRSKKAPARKKRRKKTASKVAGARPESAAAEPSAGEPAGENGATALQADAGTADHSGETGDKQK